MKDDSTPPFAPAVELGSRGGKARAAKLTPERRQEIGRNAANRRWHKETKQMIDADKYPEHAKLQPLQPLSQAIYDFLTWLDERGICLATEGCTASGHPTEELLPVLESREILLAEHFGIDLRALEAEKRAMLAAFSGDTR